MLQIANTTTISLPTLIPEEAFLFFPQEKEIRRITSKNTERIIFEGSVQYDESEKNHIQKFIAEAKKKSNFELPHDWPESETLRFLQANQFKYKQTLKTLQEHIQWKEATFPTVLTPAIEKCLQKGIVYFFGRDSRMRPILVMNGHLMNPKNVDTDVFIDSLIYLLDSVIGELFLPGQVENWHVIADLNGCGLKELSIAALKKIFTHLQSHYRARLYKLHVFNAPSSIMLPWKLSRGFIEESTREKVHFYKDGTSKELWKEINPAQVEQKFGGKAQNLTSYWPMTPCPQGFEASGTSLREALVDKEKYYQMYKSGQLNQHKVNHEIIKAVEESHRKLDSSETQSTQRRSISSPLKTQETSESESFDYEDFPSDIDESAKLNKIARYPFCMKSLFGANCKKLPICLSA